MAAFQSKQIILKDKSPKSVEIEAHSEDHFQTTATKIKLARLPELTQT